jgi:SSS family solute:Na+ symporter
VRAGNIAGLVIIIVAALWAPKIQDFGSVVKYCQQLLSYLAPPVVAVFLAGLFWKRASATGAFVALVSGLVLAVLLMIFRDQTPLADWNFLYVAPLLLVISLGILAAFSLVTAPPTADVVERFVWQPAFYQTESAELAKVPWYQNYRILPVILSVVTGVFIFIWR